jgi:lipopolysaccharide assembly outer membrane protein LptD (OstA)
VNPIGLFGENSFATPDITNTGLNSGLDKNVSDYVGSITYQPNAIYSFAARGRFDQSTFTPQRLEIEARANFDRWTLQLLYGDYAPQPLLGFLTRGEGFLTAASLKLTANWILLGSTRYDIENDRFDQSRIGVGYVDDCFMLSVTGSAVIPIRPWRLRSEMTPSWCNSACVRSARMRWPRSAFRIDLTMARPGSVEIMQRIAAASGMAASAAEAMESNS